MLRLLKKYKMVKTSRTAATCSIIIIFILLTVTSMTARGQSHAVGINEIDATETGAPDTAWIGIYITSVHDIDFRDLEYNLTFWLWVTYTSKNLDTPFLKTIEIPNAKSIETDFLTDTLGYFIAKVEAVMKDSWDINKFPFDKQTLWLSIENSSYELKDLIFVQDTVGYPYDSIAVHRSMRGWQVDSINVSIDSSRYRTTFGETDVKPPRLYSAFNARINISREEPGKTFWKIFLGMYIAFLIANICFYIQPANYDSRFQLSVGALFAAIGNKYLVEGALPESTSSTLVDSLHGLTLFFIMLTILATIISLRIVNRKKRNSAVKFDIWLALLLMFAYIVCNIIFIFF